MSHAGLTSSPATAELPAPTTVGSGVVLGHMVELADQWLKRARRKFHDAEGEQDVSGKRLIEHGAICYFNCSEELRKLADELAASHTQPKLKARKKLQA